MLEKIEDQINTDKKEPLYKKELCLIHKKKKITLSFIFIRGLFQRGWHAISRVKSWTNSDQANRTSFQNGFGVKSANVLKWTDPIWKRHIFGKNERNKWKVLFSSTVLLFKNLLIHDILRDLAWVKMSIIFTTPSLYIWHICSLLILSGLLPHINE